jgi:hypothetical protein
MKDKAETIDQARASAGAQRGLLTIARSRHLFVFIAQQVFEQLDQRSLKLVLGELRVRLDSRRDGSALLLQQLESLHDRAAADVGRNARGGRP